LRWWLDARGPPEFVGFDGESRRGLRQWLAAHGFCGGSLGSTKWREVLRGKERLGCAQWLGQLLANSSSLKTNSSRGFPAVSGVRDLGEKEEPDRWVPVVSERERGESVPVRDLLVGPRVVSPTGPNRVPGVHFPFLFRFLLFSFLFSYSIYRFCKTPSNEFKPLSEVL
jgi:hypothetical protein